MQTKGVLACNSDTPLFHPNHFGSGDQVGEGASAVVVEGGAHKDVCIC